MIFLKNIGKAFLFSFMFLFVLTFIVTLGNFFGLFSSKMVNILSYIVPFLSFLIGGIIMGKRSNQKGWLEGIKFGGIAILLFFIFDFLALDQGLKLENFLLYAILLIASILGSMVGINIKKEVS